MSTINFDVASKSDAPSNVAVFVRVRDYCAAIDQLSSKDGESSPARGGRGDASSTPQKQRIGETAARNAATPGSASKAQASARGAPSNQVTRYPLCVTVSGGNAVHVHTDSTASTSSLVAAGAIPASSQVDTISASERKFTFDGVFSSVDEMISASMPGVASGKVVMPAYSTQFDIFEATGMTAVQHALTGYNTCILAYGQTGSGKTYTMVGPPGGEATGDAGVIPRVCAELFDRISATTVFSQSGNPQAPRQYSCRVDASFFEIYNEEVNCLLSRQERLQVRQTPNGDVYLPNLHAESVCNTDRVLALLRVGLAGRHSGKTAMNSRSSRSHAVFQLRLVQSMISPTGDLIERSSRVNLVDLAGSERCGKTMAVGDRFKEGVAINASLACLGNVIHKLALRSGATSNSSAHAEDFINYRDSLLTWVLRDDLGGNSKTMMIATISPAAAHMEETMSTLRYANQVKRIRNRAVINEDHKERLIRELKLELALLRQQNAVLGGGVSELPPGTTTVTIPDSQHQSPLAFIIFTALPSNDEAANTQCNMVAAKTHVPLMISANIDEVIFTSEIRTPASPTRGFVASDSEMAVRIPMADTTSVSLQRVRTSGDVTPSWWISQSAATNHHTEHDACTVTIDDGAVLPSDGSRIRIKSGSLITIGTSMQCLLFDPMCASADGALLSTKSQTAQQQQQRLTPRMSTGSDLASATERLLASRVREARSENDFLKLKVRELKQQLRSVGFIMSNTSSTATSRAASHAHGLRTASPSPLRPGDATVPSMMEELVNATAHALPPPALVAHMETDQLPRQQHHATFQLPPSTRPNSRHHQMNTPIPFAAHHRRVTSSVDTLLHGVDDGLRAHDVLVPGDAAYAHAALNSLTNTRGHNASRYSASAASENEAMMQRHDSLPAGPLSVVPTSTRSSMHHHLSSATTSARPSAHVRSTDAVSHFDGLVRQIEALQIQVANQTSDLELLAKQKSDADRRVETLLNQQHASTSYQSRLAREIRQGLADRRADALRDLLQRMNARDGNNTSRSGVHSPAPTPRGPAVDAQSGSPTPSQTPRGLHIGGELGFDTPRSSFHARQSSGAIVADEAIAEHVQRGLLEALIDLQTDRDELENQVATLQRSCADLEVRYRTDKCTAVTLVRKCNRRLRRAKAALQTLKASAHFDLVSRLTPLNACVPPLTTMSASTETEEVIAEQPASPARRRNDDMDAVSAEVRRLRMALSDSHRDARELRLQLSAMQQALTESHGAHDVRRQELELMSDWVKRLQTSLQRRSGRLSGGIMANESARPSLGNAAVTVSAVTGDQSHNRLFAAVERATSAARDTDVEDDAVAGAAVDAQRTEMSADVLPLAPVVDVAALVQSLDEALSNVRVLYARLAAAKKQHTELEDRFATLSEHYDVTRATLVQAEARIASLEQQLASRTAVLDIERDGWTRRLSEATEIITGLEGENQDLRDVLLKEEAHTASLSTRLAEATQQRSAPAMAEEDEQLSQSLRSGHTQTSVDGTTITRDQQLVEAEKRAAEAQIVHDARVEVLESELMLERQVRAAAEEALATYHREAQRLDEDLDDVSFGGADAEIMAATGGAHSAAAAADALHSMDSAAEARNARGGNQGFRSLDAAALSTTAAPAQRHHRVRSMSGAALRRPAATGPAAGIDYAPSDDGAASTAYMSVGAKTVLSTGTMTLELPPPAAGDSGASLPCLDGNRYDADDLAAVATEELAVMRRDFAALVSSQRDAFVAAVTGVARERHPSTPKPDSRGRSATTRATPVQQQQQPRLSAPLVRPSPIRRGIRAVTPVYRSSTHTPLSRVNSTSRTASPFARQSAPVLPPLGSRTTARRSSSGLPGSRAATPLSRAATPPARAATPPQRSSQHGVVPRVRSQTPEGTMSKTLVRHTVTTASVGVNTGARTHRGSAIGVQPLTDQPPFSPARGTKSTTLTRGASTHLGTPLANRRRATTSVLTASPPPPPTDRERRQQQMAELEEAGRRRAANERVLHERIEQIDRENRMQRHLAERQRQLDNERQHSRKLEVQVKDLAETVEELRMIVHAHADPFSSSNTDLDDALAPFHAGVPLSATLDEAALLETIEAKLDTYATAAAQAPPVFDHAELTVVRVCLHRLFARLKPIVITLTKSAAQGYLKAASNAQQSLGIVFNQAMGELRGTVVAVSTRPGDLRHGAAWASVSDDRVAALPHSHRQALLKALRELVVWYDAYASGASASALAAGGKTAALEAHAAHAELVRNGTVVIKLARAAAIGEFASFSTTASAMPATAKGTAAGGFALTKALLAAGTKPASAKGFLTGAAQRRPTRCPAAEPSPAKPLASATAPVPKLMVTAAEDHAMTSAVSQPVAVKASAQRDYSPMPTRPGGVAAAAARNRPAFMPSDSHTLEACAHLLVDHRATDREASPQASRVMTNRLVRQATVDNVLRSSPPSAAEMSTTTASAAASPARMTLRAAQQAASLKASVFEHEERQDDEQSTASPLTLSPLKNSSPLGLKPRHSAADEPFSRSNTQQRPSAAAGLENGDTRLERSHTSAGLSQHAVSTGAARRSPASSFVSLTTGTGNSATTALVMPPAKLRNAGPSVPSLKTLQGLRR
jgi:hypothetical protein